MSWLKPRSIRGQLFSGLILLEGLLVVVFATLFVREQAAEIHNRSQVRLQLQANLLASQSEDSLSSGNLHDLAPTMRAMVNSPTVFAAQVTDADGRVIASSDPSLNGKDSLTAAEKSHMVGQAGAAHATVFTGAHNSLESVAPILDGRLLRGYAWVYENRELDQQQIYSLIRITVIFGLLGALGTAIVAHYLASVITRPLSTLLTATRNLIRDPESKEGFPLAITTFNEAAELTRAFNRMVTSIDQQRAGLNDTLALLDSMLENAPIGFAFFDRKFRYVRVNQFLADMDELAVSRHLGRTVAEVTPGPAGELLQNCIQEVFDTGCAVRDVELSTSPGSDGHSSQSRAAAGFNERSWLVNIYPVKTVTNTVRWVGAIIVETTERKRSEEALRRTEKLAAAGRLAASIAHEINNPLEAVTNLLYLIRHQPCLDAQALAYADAAQGEVARVSEITQQTLRFYRQSTLPAKTNIPELLDSVLTLHQGRIHALQIDVARHYDEGVELFCFAGELRQLFANLISNSLDAMGQAGRLRLSVRHSRSWVDGAPGVRVFVADTGSGMSEATRRRIFEPFFTTKEATGTGLGLWVSEEIVRKHNARISVCSRTLEQAAGAGQGAGTVFMVFFPEQGITPRPRATPMTEHQPA